MAYDAKLATRIDQLVRDWPGLTSKPMFGGVAYLLRGHMCIGIWKDSLIVRCPADDYPALLKKKNVRLMDITGRAMKGWLRIEPQGFATKAALAKWLALSRAHVSTLPPK
jgi:hypothetical protein